MRVCADPDLTFLHPDSITNRDFSAGNEQLPELIHLGQLDLSSIVDDMLPNENWDGGFGSPRAEQNGGKTEGGQTEAVGGAQDRDVGEWGL